MSSHQNETGSTGYTIENCHVAHHMSPFPFPGIWSHDGRYLGSDMRDFVNGCTIAGAVIDSGGLFRWMTQDEYAEAIK